MLTVGPNLGVMVNGDIGEEHYAALMRQWRVIDGVVQASVISVGATLPPSINIDGDMHIVGVGAFGEWTGRDGNLARYYAVGDGSPAWEFIVPKHGWEVRNKSDLDGAKPAKMVFCEDNVWRTDSGSAAEEQTVLNVTDTEYQLSTTDTKSYIRLIASSAKTIVIRAEVDYPLPANSSWIIRNAGTGNATITASIAAINLPAGASLVVPPGGTVTLKRVSVNTFDLTGETTGTTFGTITSVNGDTGPAVFLDAADVGAATAAQGAKADTAVQPAALTSALEGKEDTANKVQNLSSPSSTTYPSSQAVATAIAGVASGLTPKGEWNSLTNTPTLTSSVGTNGWYYVVSVASSGATTLNGISAWGLGDKVIFSGGVWIKEPNYQNVTSVNGATGAVAVSVASIGAAPSSHVGATGAAHGNVTTSVAGFASPADKVKIDAAAPAASPTFTGDVVLPATTTIGAVTPTQISYLSGLTSDVQTQLNGKAGTTAPTFANSLTVNAAVGQASILLQQAGTTNGRVYAAGGPGFDVNIEAGRFIAMIPASSFLVNISNATKFSVDAALTSIYNNLSLSGLAQRITGDFSNATLSNRVAFQTSTANAGTHIPAIPNGTSDSTSFRVYSSSDFANTSIGRFALSPSTTGLVIASEAIGSGVLQPISLLMQGVAGLILDTSNNTNITGHLNLTGASKRIFGDFSNATVAARIHFQSGVSNGATRVSAIPNGTATTCNFEAYNNSDPTNASGVRLTATSSDVRLESIITGSGSYLPLQIYNGGSAKITLSPAGDTTFAGAITVNLGATINVAGAGNNSLVLNSVGASHLVPFQTSGANRAFINTYASGIQFLDSGGGVQLGLTTAGITANTPSAGNNSSLVATTSFVQTALTSLNASNLLSGTIPNARLAFTINTASSANTVVQRDGSGDIYANNIVASNTIYASNFSGGGANLTGLNANNLSAGIVPAARLLGGNYVANTFRAQGAGATDTSEIAAGAFDYTSTPSYSGTLIKHFGTGVAGNIGTSGIPYANTGMVLFQNVSSGFITSNGSHLYMGANSLKSVRFSNGGNVDFYYDMAATNITVSGTFTGNGSGITTLNASNVSSGTLNAARLPFSYGAASVANNVVQRDGVGDIYLRDSVGRNSVLTGYVQVGAAGGVISDTYVANGQTPIWRIGSNPTYGISYFQAAAGNAGQDTIGFHFGTATSAGSQFKFRNDGTLFANFIAGDGGYLTGLNATNLAFGTVPNARLNTASTSAAGIVQLGDGSSAPSATKAATEQWVYGINQSLSTLGGYAIYNDKPEQLYQSLGTVSGAVTVSSGSGIHVIATVNGNTTWTFPTPASNKALALTLELTNGGAYTMTFPAGTLWEGGTQPALTVSGKDRLVFTKAGTNAWIGSRAGKDIK